MLLSQLIKNASGDFGVSGITLKGDDGEKIRYNYKIMRRALSKPETDAIDEAQQNMFPKLIEEPWDPIVSRMASPSKKALLTALLLTGLGGVGGGVIGNMSGNTAAGAGIGGGLGLLLGGILGGKQWKDQKDVNESLEDFMTRLPKGQTTIRDLRAHPLYRLEQ